MPMPALVHNKLKEWILENGPVKCEGTEHAKLMEDVKIAFEQSNDSLPKNLLLKYLANRLLQQHRGVIIKGDRKGELPGLYPEKVRERNTSEKQKESKRKWNSSENGKAMKQVHTRAGYQNKRFKENV